MTTEELIAFENDIAETFNMKEIFAPIHLQDNNIEQLVEIFKDVNIEDWVCGTWRFHVESLLKGVPPKVLKEAILDGRSISLCFKEQRVITSAIVGGIIPIAAGIAFDIKRKNQSNKVYCFVGEMSSTTGVFREAYEYVKNWDLPLIFVVSDNGKSVCTDTRLAWNTQKLTFEPEIAGKEIHKTKHLWYYKYVLDWPHSGSGVRINF